MGKIREMLRAHDVGACSDLEQKVLMRLAKIEKTRRLAFLSMSVLGLLMSIGASVPAVHYLSTAMSNSSFVFYAKLLISDTGVVASLWKEFALSIAESLPVMELAFVTIVLFLFISSIRAILVFLPLTHLRGAYAGMSHN